MFLLFQLFLSGKSPIPILLEDQILFKRDFIDITHVIVVAGFLRTIHYESLTSLLLREPCIEELVCRKRQRFLIEKTHFVFKKEKIKPD